VGAYTGFFIIKMGKYTLKKREGCRSDQFCEEPALAILYQVFTTHLNTFKHTNIQSYNAYSQNINNQHIPYNYVDLIYSYNNLI
jgi:hypothetical protein